MDSLFDGSQILILTGAAGHLGSALLRMLAGSAAEVRALVLPGDALQIEAPNIRRFEGDVCQIETLRPLFENAEGRSLVVLHAAGIITISEELPPALRAVNVGGTLNLLRLSAEYGVSRFVDVSSVHALPVLPAGQTIREITAFSPALVAGGYAKTKAEAAQAVLDAGKTGLDVVVVHPSGILGPYDAGGNHLVQMLSEYLRGQLPAVVRGGYDFVDVRDVARGCLLAAKCGRRGECYLLSGHYAEIGELLSLAAACSGGKTPLVLPLWLAHGAVPFVELGAKLSGRRPLYTRYALQTVAANGSFSCEKAESELGYTRRPLAETVRDTVGWLRAGS